jgi:hypothetical protein
MTDEFKGNSRKMSGTGEEVTTFRFSRTKIKIWENSNFDLYAAAVSAE